MKKRYQIFKILIGIVFLFTLFNSVFTSISADETGSILYVGGSGDGNYSSIQIAVKEAQDGDTIIVYPGIYHETIRIDSSIHLNGLSADETIIRGDNLSNVIKVNADGVKLSNLTIEKSGIYVKSDDNTDEDDDSDDGLTPVQPILDLRILPVNFSGVYSDFDNTIISSCLFKDCETGVFLRNGSKNQISDCVFMNNTQSGYFIQLKQVKIMDCQVHENQFGFYFSFTTNSKMVSCNISNNVDVGLFLTDSDANQFTLNHLRNNSFAVILQNNCEGNMFYSNTIISNRQMQALDNCNNSWDNGHIGNYWDDYTGNDSNNDGIGDTPYDILQISKDRFPLMQKPTGSSGEITIRINSPLTYETITEEIILSGEVESTNPIDQVLVRFDQSDWIVAQGTSSWSAPLDTKGFTSGSYDIYISVKTSNLQTEVFHDSIILTSEDTNGSEGEPEPTDTPGFLFVFMLLATMIVVFMLKIRK